MQETNTDICLKKTECTMMYDDRYPIIFSMIKQRNGCKIFIGYKTDKKLITKFQQKMIGYPNKIEKTHDMFFFNQR